MRNRLLHQPALLAVAIQLGIGACGGGDSPVTTPPPPVTPPPTTPPPGAVAARIAVLAGDGQTAATSDTVPTRPAVRVEDASGNPVAGQLVTFTVDSGGGSITGGAAQSGSDGVARSGPWTLGPSEGANVLRVSVTGVAPVMIRAVARDSILSLTDTTLVGGGGTVTANRPEKPFDGAEITVPPNSFSVATRWSLTAVRVTPAPPPGTDLVFHPWALRVDTDAGLSQRLIRVRLPVERPDGAYLIPFLWNEATGRFDLLPILDQDSTGITAVSRHFSADLLEIPETAAPASRVVTGAATSPGVTIVLAQMPASVFPTASVLFDPRRDTWEFGNYITPIAPQGLDVGHNVTSLHYYRTLRPRLGSLAGRFNLITGQPDNPNDNPEGIRLAAVTHVMAVSDVNTDPFNADITAWAEAVAAAGKASRDKVTVLQIAAALALTREPVLVLAPLKDRRDGKLRAHTFLVYRTAGGALSHAGTGFDFTQSWRSSTGRLAPMTMNDVTGTQEFFQAIIPLGTTPIYPMRALDPGLWGQFFAKTVGDIDFPSAHVESRVGTDPWKPVTSSVHVWVDEVQLRTICEFCPHPRGSVPEVPPSGEPKEQFLLVTDVAEQTIADNSQGAPVNLKLAPGTHTVGLTMFTFEPAATWHGTLWSYLDHRPLEVRSSRLMIDPDDQQVTSGDTASFVARVIGAPYGSARQYRWDFGDGTQSVTVSGDSTIKHAYRATPGTYTATVSLVETATGTVLAGDEATVEVVAPVSIWRLTSLAITGQTGSMPHDSLKGRALVTYEWYFRIRDRLARIMNGTDGYLHYHNGTDSIPDQIDHDYDGNFAEPISYQEALWIQPRGLSYTGLGGERAHFPWSPSVMLARNETWATTDFPPQPSISNAGDLSTGVISGRAYIEGMVVAGTGNIQATVISDASVVKNGSTISGSVTFTYRAFLGLSVNKTWSVTYTLTGTRL